MKFFRKSSHGVHRKRFDLNAVTSPPVKPQVWHHSCRHFVFWSQKWSYLDKGVELRRIITTVNDFVTSSRQLAAAEANSQDLTLHDFKPWYNLGCFYTCSLVHLVWMSCNSCTFSFWFILFLQRQNFKQSKISTKVLWEPSFRSLVGNDISQIPSPSAFCLTFRKRPDF